ncbi:MAG: amino acid adenylation domain-containing protein [Cellvibrionaceae bacterium]|jgi:amino acid adenylation domain-containing protein
MKEDKRELLDLVSRLADLNIKIGVQDGNLRISAPKGSLTAKLRDELVLHKEALIEFYQEPIIPTTHDAFIQLADRSDWTALPLAYSQQGIWTVEKINPNEAAHHVPTGVEFIGAIRPEFLKKAIGLVMERHESLRTSFHEYNNLPYPVIEDKVAIPFKEVDLTQLANGDRELELQRMLRQNFNKPFDLSVAPLFRVLFIKLEPDRHQLVIILHHIISDGWSVGILMQELADSYKAFLSDSLPDLTPLRVQYIDYAAWQNARFKSKDDYRLGIEYWGEHLAGAPPVLKLPTDRPRKALEKGMIARSIKFSVSREVSASINQLAKREHVTPFMVLLSTCYILFYRYSRQDDIVIAMPIANRPQEDVESIIGLFANTIALRSKVDSSLTFSEYLKKIRRIALEGFDHQDIPFELLVEHLNPERNSRWNLIYQVMIVLQNNALAWPESEGLETRFLTDFSLENTALDLFFEMYERDGQFGGSVNYSTDLFDEITVRRMIGHFLTLLTAAVKAPSMTLRDLPLMLPVELNQVLVDWNKTDFPFPDEATVHELFELRVRQSGDQIALIVPENETRLTWTELNQKANQLAHYLQNIGIKEDSVVGISMARSAEMIISLLAILKTGAAWLPLDPEYPAERLQYMVEDAKPDAIIIQSTQPSWLDQFDNNLISLDTVHEEIKNQPDTNLLVSGNAESKMYILYTSGSTGKAKGVVGHHQGAINRFSWMWNKYPFTASEVAAQKTSLNFVDSIWEIFGPLLKGVPLVIVPELTAADPDRLVLFLAKHKVSRLVLVPSLLHVLLNQFENLALVLPDLKLWTTSGEALSVDLYNRFSQAYPDATLLNIYGSSEVAADVTCFDTTKYPTLDRMHIGKPIDNMRIYLLDDHLKPVPTGVPGEICVAGPGLALGYHNRPELTAERFIPNSITGSGRMFRTGDLGRFNADGYIEYMGRSDFQLKIRGVRIEPGEIEHTLISHPEIQEALVSSVLNKEGQPDLVCWFVMADGASSSLELSELRIFLSNQLPSYMIPTRFMDLPEFPLTPNGKIDRSKLPTPLINMSESSGPFTSPRDEIEESLINMWSEILGLQKISIFDDFFEIGGNSMGAVQMFGHIRDRFGVNLNLGRLFRTATVAALADVIRLQQLKDTDSSPTTVLQAETASSEPDFEYLKRINKGNSQKRAVFCVHGAGGNVLFFQKWRNSLKDLPFWAFEARGVDGITPPHESVVEMAAAYIQEMLQVEPEGPWVLAGYSGGGVVALEMAIQLKAMGYKTPPIVMLDTYHPEIRARNFTMRDRIQVLKASPIKYVKDVAKRTIGVGQREYSREEMDAMMADGTPLPIELRDDYMTDQFVKLLQQYGDPMPYHGKVLLLCAEETWQMFAHAGNERGWKGVLTQLEIRKIPGDHFSVIEEPNLFELVKQLRFGVERFSNESNE